MAAKKTRWQRADDNFRSQIDHFMVDSKMKKQDIARELGISLPTWRKYYESPSTMTRMRERMLMMLFERHGATYDMTLGEGAGACATLKSC